MEEKMRLQKKGKENKAEDDDDDEEEEEDDNDGEDPGSIDDGSPVPANHYANENKSERPYLTTPAPLSSNHQPQSVVQPIRTTVETEKVEVIEIKSDGSSGHLIPGHN